MGVDLERKTAQRMGRATLQVERRNTTHPRSPSKDRFPRGNFLEKVLVVETVAAADWSGGRGVPTETIVRVCFPHPSAEDDGDDSITSDASPANELNCLSYFPDEIKVNEGMARFGWVCDGELVIVSCTEVELPE